MPKIYAHASTNANEVKIITIIMKVIWIFVCNAHAHTHTFLFIVQSNHQLNLATNEGRKKNTTTKSNGKERNEEKTLVYDQC